MAFTVVITDAEFPSVQPETEVLARIGATVLVGNCRTPEDVLEVARDADGLLVQYAPITQEVIARLRKCRVIARYGVGVDTIDVAAATRAGIAVCNVTGYCVDEVSEHVLALLLACARHIPQLNSSVKAGRWDVTQIAPKIERVAGQHLGLIGFGEIARAVAAKAQALVLKVKAFDPFVDGAAMSALGVEKVDEITCLLQTSDFVSIHVPLSPSTYHLISRRELASMKATAYLLNTSRGSLIDEDALYDALVNGTIGGAALDVLEIEPPSRDNPLLELENVIFTPHAAYYSLTSLLALQTRAAEAVAAVLMGETPRSLVNPDVLLR
ncbi:MAG: C-terminal binding protein [Chloroflexota bacterium]